MVKNQFKKKPLLIILAILIILPLRASTYASETKQVESISWDQFVEKTNKYSSEFENIMDRSKQTARLQNEALQKAMEMDDQEQAKKIIAETSDKLAQIIKELKLLEPPSELALYHKKMIESYENRKISNDAMLNKNTQVANEYNYKATLSEKEAMIEMKKVCINYNAPKEEIEKLNQLIKTY